MIEKVDEKLEAGKVVLRIVNLGQVEGSSS
jgi:hypothetical protein